MSPLPPEAAQVAEALRSTIRGLVDAGAPLAPFTSYRLGGAAAVLVEAWDESDLVATAGEAARFGLPILTLGRGSNVLVSDDGYPGVVVRLGKGFDWMRERDGGLEAGGAARLPQMANWAARRGLGVPSRGWRPGRQRRSRRPSPGTGARSSSRRSRRSAAGRAP